MSDEKIDDETRLLAAVAYGEASTANDSDEIGGIAFAVSNRCRAWGGKTVSALKAADPNYAYAWDGSNARNKKTGQIVDGAERGRYDEVWISTFAHSSTIFWKHPTEHITATGGGKSTNEHNKSSSSVNAVHAVIHSRRRIVGFKW